mgnify:CR=1 FL=1
MKRKIIVATLILVSGFIFAGYLGFKWLDNRRRYASTDAFFVKSDAISNISFKRVSGKIVKMYYKEGDSVKKGNILAEIDTEDYVLKKGLIAHKIQGLISEKEALINQIKKIKSELRVEEEIKKDSYLAVVHEVEALKKSIDELSIQISQSEKDYNRLKNLFQENAVPLQKLEEAETQNLMLKARKESLTFKLKSLEQKKAILEGEIRMVKAKSLVIPELEAKLNSLIEQIQVGKKELEDTENLIEECFLRAPFDGIVGNKYTEVGSVIKGGTFVYSLVDNTNIFGYVLMEEEKIYGIKPGSRTTIRIDAFPEKIYEGEVDKIYPASAATYALVPRDISAGEFTKVSQRIPIRIRFTKGDTSILRVGMGGEVQIAR